MNRRHRRVISCFASLLRERLLGGVHTSEDAVRYTFFHALTLCGRYSHLNISLEEPLPTHAGRQLDTVLYSKDKRRPILVAEFKYHRERFTRRPLTEMSASVYCDLFRLAFAEAIWGAKAYLIWVTDQEMIRYFSNTRNNVSELIDLNPGEELKIGTRNKGERSASFVNALQGFWNPALITCVHNENLNESANLRVFSVVHQPHPVYSSHRS